MNMPKKKCCDVIFYLSFRIFSHIYAYLILLMWRHSSNAIFTEKAIGTHLSIILTAFRGTTFSRSFDDSY